MQASTGAVADLMAQFRQGNRQAAEQLVELLYPELKRLAAAKMKSERPEHTWQPTVLVHELYFELLRVKALRDPDNNDEKAAFLGFAGFLMKRLLARHARPLSSKAIKVEAEDDMKNFDAAGVETLTHIELMLARLGAIDPKFRTVVELKVFEGRTGDEVAARLGCSRRTADRYWTFACHWLERELEGGVAQG